MFGAITSKPAKAAEAELVARAQGHRASSTARRSCGCGRLFDLYTCLRPCKAYPGNPLNYKEGIDLVVFRENTEDLYAGVEFSPVPLELADDAGQAAEAVRAVRRAAGERIRHLVQDQHAEAARSGSSRAAFDFARKFGRKKVTIVHKANVVRATDGLFLEQAREVAKDFPEIELDEANIDALTMWLLKNPFNYDVLVAPEPVRRHHLGPVRADGRRPRLRLLGQHRRRSWRCSSRRTARRRSTPGSTR